jgi:hypothetical protein
MSSQTLSPDTLQPPPLSSQLYAWYPDWPSPNLCLHKPELAALIPLPHGELLDTSSLPHFSPSAHALYAPADVMCYRILQ